MLTKWVCQNFGLCHDLSKSIFETHRLKSMLLPKAQF